MIAILENYFLYKVFIRQKKENENANIINIGYILYAVKELYIKGLISDIAVAKYLPDQCLQVFNMVVRRFVS